MKSESWKLIDLLNSASAFFEEKAIENPRGNAEALLGKTLSLPNIELYLQFDRPLLPAEVDQFRDFVKRRLLHEPLQQILGKVEFLDCTIEVPRGLPVPRPETEELVQQAISILHELKPRPARVLEIGSGTGCIAVALAKALGDTDVDTIDVDPAAVECTQRNAAANQVEQRVQCLKGNVLHADIRSSLRPPYDAVISNPPYVREADYSALAPEIVQFENRAALVAGEDGLKFFRRIAELLPDLVKPGGYCFLEIGLGQAEAVSKLLKPVSTETQVHPDLSGIPRIIVSVI